MLNTDDLGIKKKLLRGERQSHYRNEVKTPAEYFFEADEAHPTAIVTTPPEFEISNRESYNVTRDEDYAATTFMSM